MAPLVPAPRSGIGGIVDKITGTTRLARGKTKAPQPKATSAPRLPRRKYSGPKSQKNAAFPNDPNPAYANEAGVPYTP